jgi:hypothetical protein
VELSRRSGGENVWRVLQGIQHPRAAVKPDIVRMDTFYSMWRSRTIPDPKGGDQPACETVLLHREDFKIPENMARFAVKHGMGGFVKKLGPEVSAFVTQRRQRCLPLCHHPPPPPPPPPEPHFQL